MRQKNKQTADKLRQLLNEDSCGKEPMVCFSYEETKPEIEKSTEVKLFKRNLRPRVERMQSAIY